jgi:hypothetical protein
LLRHAISAFPLSPLRLRDPPIQLFLLRLALLALRLCLLSLALFALRLCLLRGLALFALRSKTVLRTPRVFFDTQSISVASCTEVGTHYPVVVYCLIFLSNCSL